MDAEMHSENSWFPNKRGGEGGVGHCSNGQSGYWMASKSNQKDTIKRDAGDNAKGLKIAPFRIHDTRYESSMQV